MNWGIKLTKKDLITIVLLCIVFFGLATWNVGLVNAPVTNWQSTQQKSFYVDLGSSQQLQTVYFWVQKGNASAQVYSGSPGNWSYIGEKNLQDRDTDYSVQQSMQVNVDTRYLLFNVTPANFDSRPNFYWSVPNPTDRQPSPLVEVSEIGIADPNNHQIPITAITGQNNTDATITKLADEQNSLEIPPTYMSKMYFDEVYFARSAIEYVNHQIPLERTHPPLGKLIQAVGVAAVGVTPFGWRIMGVVFGTFIVALIYLLGKKLFGTWIGGFSAAFLMTFDFMHFTMARIGTVDTYVVFFSLVSQLFFLIYFMGILKDGWRKTSIWPLFLAVVFFALGFSTKWFTVFGALGLFALLLAVRFRDAIKVKAGLAAKYLALFDYPAFWFFGFILLAVGIYFMTYIPEMVAGDSFPTIVNLQFAMASFHSGSVVDSSSSPWWSWPFMFGTGSAVPRWFDISYFPNSKVISTITVLGNPAVWWLGFACMLALTAMVIYKSGLVNGLRNRIAKSSTGKTGFTGKGLDAAAVFIVVVFFFSWLPYVFIGRATYIYHFYLSVPLLCLAITYFINMSWNSRYGKVAAIAIFAASVAMFVLFYPVISGAPVDASYIHKYLDWFPSRFYAP